MSKSTQSSKTSNFIHEEEYQKAIKDLEEKYKDPKFKKYFKEDYLRELQEIKNKYLHK